MNLFAIQANLIELRPYDSIEHQICVKIVGTASNSFPIISSFCQEVDLCSFFNIFLDIISGKYRTNSSQIQDYVDDLEVIERTTRDVKKSGLVLKKTACEVESEHLSRKSRIKLFLRS